VPGTKPRQIASIGPEYPNCDVLSATLSVFAADRSALAVLVEAQGDRLVFEALNLTSVLGTIIEVVGDLCG
jgi:hypothetical protein